MSVFPQPSPAPPYLGVQITLTTANTVYNLLKLLKAIEPSWPASGFFITLQVDSTSPNSPTVSLGDGKMPASATPSRVGWKLLSGSGFTFPGGGYVGEVSTGSIFLQSTADGALVNVQCFKA